MQQDLSCPHTQSYRMHVIELVAVIGVLNMVRLSQGTEETSLTLGYISEAVDNPSAYSVVCMSEWWDRRTIVEKILVNYSTNTRPLFQTDEIMGKMDVMVAYMSAPEVHYLQRYISTSLQRYYYYQLNNFDLSHKLWYITRPEVVPGSGRSERFVLDECTNQQAVVNFLSQIIYGIDWKRISILYDDSYANEASAVTEVLSLIGIRISQYHIKTNQSMASILYRSYHAVTLGWRRYLLMGSKLTIHKVFQELNLFDEPGFGPTAMKTFSLWLAWSRDVTSLGLESKVSNISNVALLERPGCNERKTAMHSQLFQSSESDGICELLKTSDHNDTQKSTVSWKLFSGIETILKSDQNKALMFKLSTAVWQAHGRHFKTVFWNRKVVTLTIDQVFPNMKYGLNDMHITVTTLEWPMFVSSKQLEDGSLQYFGLCIDLLIEASRKLNFSYTIKSPADREWGRQVNGHWTGLIGDIVYQKADLLVAPVSVQEERVAVMDFTTAFYTDYYNIIFKMPDKEKTRWMILLRPLNWKVLLTVACVLPLMTSCVWLCERFSPFLDVTRRPTHPGLHRIDDCLLYMCGALFSRSGCHLPRAMSGRTLLSFWWIFVVLLVASYCGNLMALLTVTRDDKPFNTIADMIRQDKYIWGTNAGAYMFELLRSSKDSEYKQVWEGMNRFAEINPDVMAVSLADHEKLLEKGNYVYIADTLVVDTFLNMNCDYVKGSEEFLMLQYSVGLPKKSAYTSLFTDQIISFHEGGLIEMWVKRWSPKAISCSALLQTQARKIMLIDMQSSFYLLLTGIVLSCVVCAIEILTKKR